jgi:hypothetical protein
MKTYNPAWVAALERGEAVSHGAIRIETAGYTPLRLWGGHGALVLDDENYVGIGERGLITVAGGQLGSGEQGITLELSGVDPAVQIDFAAAKLAPVLIWRLGFDITRRNLLDATKFTRGRVQEIYSEEVLGGEAKIVVQVEGAVRGMGRSSARMRSDADQRLINGADAGFKTIAIAGEKNLYWGGQTPARADQALPGGQIGGLLSRLVNQARR